MMIRPSASSGFELSVSARDDGTLEAVYIRFASGRTHETREIIADALLADYDASGALLGLELLAPVRLNDLAGQAPSARRDGFMRFVEQSVPPGFIAA